VEGASAVTLESTGGTEVTLSGSFLLQAPASSKVPTATRIQTRFSRIWFILPKWPRPAKVQIPYHPEYAGEQGPFRRTTDIFCHSSSVDGRLEFLFPRDDDSCMIFRERLLSQYHEKNFVFSPLFFLCGGVGV